MGHDQNQERALHVAQLAAVQAGAMNAMRLTMAKDILCSFISGLPADWPDGKPLSRESMHVVASAAVALADELLEQLKHNRATPPAF